MFGRVAIGGLVTAFGLVPAACGQWVVVYLHPEGVDATASRASGIRDGQISGSVNIDGVNRASLWMEFHTWVDLTPGGSSGADAWDVADGHQVGVALIDGVERASLWNGTAASRIDLHPAMAAESLAYGAGDGEQVGYVGAGGVKRAALWRGSAESWIELSTEPSAALDADDGKQVGHVNSRAVLWTGTTGSLVSLHPTAAAYSIAQAISGAEQAGIAIIGGYNHAALWRGSVESWVDLHPAGALWSEAEDVFEGVQVGIIGVEDRGRAAIWRGTADSWFDLHSTLPPDFLRSQALGVWRSERVTYVVGEGFNSARPGDEALLWVWDCPADLTENFAVDFPDYLEFLNLYDAGDARADFTADGIVDFTDYLEFLNHYDAGC